MSSTATLLRIKCGAYSRAALFNNFCFTCLLIGDGGVIYTYGGVIYIYDMKFLIFLNERTL